MCTSSLGQSGGRNHTRSIFCSKKHCLVINHCSLPSAGGKAGSVRSCNSCNGRGVKVTIRHIGPGMVQQMQSPCNICKGEGMHWMRIKEFIV